MRTAGVFKGDWKSIKTERLYLPQENSDENTSMWAEESKWARKVLNIPIICWT